MKNLDSRAQLNEQAQYIKRLMNLYLGQAISNARRKKGISQRELNKISGVALASISDLENGKVIPRIDLVLKLLFVLDIPLSDVFSKKLIRGINQEESISDSTQESYKDEDIAVILATQYNLKATRISEILDYIEFIKNKNK